jgi:hypothetical protein
MPPLLFPFIFLCICALKFVWIIFLVCVATYINRFPQWASRKGEEISEAGFNNEPMLI